MSAAGAGRSAGARQSRPPGPADGTKRSAPAGGRGPGLPATGGTSRRAHGPLQRCTWLLPLTECRPPRCSSRTDFSAQGVADPGSSRRSGPSPRRASAVAPARAAPATRPKGPPGGRTGRREVPGRVPIFGDGGPTHRRQLTTGFLGHGGTHRLHLDRLPACAPVRNPGEGRWGHLTGGALRHVCDWRLPHSAVNSATRVSGRVANHVFSRASFEAPTFRSLGPGQ
jgi:hypothetical protein